LTKNNASLTYFDLNYRQNLTKPTFLGGYGPAFDPLTGYTLLVQMVIAVLPPPFICQVPKNDVSLQRNLKDLKGRMTSRKLVSTPNSFIVTCKL